MVSWARNEYYKLQWWLTDSNILAAFVQCSFSTLQKHPILKTLWMFVQTELHILHLCVYGLETRWEMWLRFSVRVCLLSKCICEYMSAGILRVNSNVLLHLSFLAPAGDALLHRNLKIPPSWWCEPCPQSSTKYFPNMEQSCHFFLIIGHHEKIYTYTHNWFTLWETASLEVFLWSQNRSFAFREWTWQCQLLVLNHGTASKSLSVSLQLDEEL